MITLETTFEDIQDAAKILEGVILRTPILLSPWLSEQANASIFLKLENLQVMSSFKVRGAYVKISKLTREQKRKGIIAMSAGNHAQGVAYHARALGIPTTIVMPKTTPFSKIESTQCLGATVLLEGQNLDESSDYASLLPKKEGLTLIHPYNDPAIIAGQGTVALEMLADVPDLDVLIIPIGGGGLASGMAIAAKTINPKIKIIGVQSATCPSLAQVLYPERGLTPTGGISSSLAEGIAVKSPGLLAQKILKKHLSDIIIVTEDQIEAAIEDLLIHGKLIAEGAGAAGVAALMAAPQYFSGHKVGTVICGGNIDARVLSSLLLRGLVHHGKLVRLKIEINDAPGVLGQISKIIGDAGGNIFEVNHQRLFNHITVKMAVLDAIVETRDQDHAKNIMTRLEAGGFPTKMVV